MVLTVGYRFQRRANLPFAFRRLARQRQHCWSVEDYGMFEIIRISQLCPWWSVPPSVAIERKQKTIEAYSQPCEPCGALRTAGAHSLSSGESLLPVSNQFFASGWHSALLGTD